MTQDEVEVPWPDVDVPAGFEREGRAAHPRGGAEFTALHTAQRLLQDRLAGPALPPEFATAVTARLRDIADVLDAHQMAEPGPHRRLAPRSARPRPSATAAVRDR